MAPTSSSRPILRRKIWISDAASSTKRIRLTTCEKEVERNASLTFTAANWNAAQTVTVTGVDDALADGEVAYTIVTAPAVSADPSYNGLDAPNVSAVNADDDVPGGIVVTPTTGLQTTEAGGTAQFTLVLASQPTANVTIGLTSSDATEGTVAPASLTFTLANWSVAQAVTVTGVDDSQADGDVAYTINTAAAVSRDPAYSGVNPPDVAVTSLDDDLPEHRFDFGTASSPLAAGYTRVAHSTTYTPAHGYGWLNGSVWSRDRGSGTDLTRDFNFTRVATFALDVANGTYNVTLTTGDARYRQGAVAVILEGTQVDSIRTEAGQFITRSYQVDVADGRLTLTLDSEGGYSRYCLINALEVAAITVGASAPATRPPRRPADDEPLPEPLLGPEIVVAPRRGPAPLEIEAAAFGLGPRATCTWDFGDGAEPKRGRDVTHIYWSPGTYTISLTAGGRTPRATVVVPPPKK